MPEPDRSPLPSGEEALFRLMLASVAGMVIWSIFQDSALTLAATESVWWLFGSASTP